MEILFYFLTFLVRYTKQTDIWSFGMCCYELLSLRSPYYEINKSDEITDLILKGVLPTLPPSLDPKYDPFKRLMERCLRVDSELRPPADELVAHLEKIQPILKQMAENEESRKLLHLSIQ